MENILIYLIALLILVIIDAIWIKFVAYKFYKKDLFSVINSQTKILPAIIFYLIFPLALLYLVNPVNNNFYEVCFKAAVFGLVTYGTYALTNHAIILGWKLRNTALEIFWGICISLITSILLYLIF